MNNGHMLAAAVAQQQGAPPIQVATPINDVQLVALVASSLDKDLEPRAAVAEAVEIVAEAILQMRGGAALPERVRQLMKERSLES